MGRKGILARIKWEKEHSNYKAFLHPDYSFLKIKFSEVCVFCLCEIKVLNFYESDSKGDVFFNNIFRYTRPSAILVLNCPVTKVTICHDTSSTFWTFTLHYVITNNTASPALWSIWCDKLSCYHPSYTCLAYYDFQRNPFLSLCYSPNKKWRLVVLFWNLGGPVANLSTVEYGPRDIS